MLEDSLVSLDGHRHWLHAGSGLELRNRVASHISVAGDLNLTLGRSLSASSVSASIWVSGFKLFSVGFSMLEGMGLPASLATIRGLIAIDKLLLRKTEELAGFKEVSTLDSAHSREGPARTAVALILDLVYGTLWPPVLAWSEVGVIELDLVPLSSLSGTSVSEHGLSLTLGHGGEHVVLNSEGVARVRVDLSELSVLLSEELESEVVLLLSSVAETPLSHVGHELRVELWAVEVLLAWVAEEGSESAEVLHWHFAI